MSQLGIPTEVSIQEVTREKTFGGSIALCARAAALEGKQVQDAVKTSEGKAVDKAAWSRSIDGGEGVEWSKLIQIMDLCGNDAPLRWMLHARGYDLSSLRKRETETERALRIANERITQLEQEREVERRLFRDLRVAA